MSHRAWGLRLREWLKHPMVGIWIVVHGMLLSATLNFVLRSTELPPWRFYGTLLALVALLLLYLRPDASPPPLVRTVRARNLRFLLAGAGLVLLINALGAASPGGNFLPFLLFVLVGNAIYDLPFPHALLYSVALWVAWLLAIAIVEDRTLASLWLNGLSVGYGICFTAIFSLIAVRYSEQSARATRLVEELRATTAELEASREREKGLAIAQERVRLARDIHDGLGHHLTVLTVQLQAAAKLIERDPSRAAIAVATCQTVTQAALTEVRQSVALLRGTPLDGLSLETALHNLVTTFDDCSPITARFERQGIAQPLSSAAAITLYRAVQEGLTNAQKHAAAQCVRVTLRYDPGMVGVEVWNDGPPLRTPDPSGGFGIAGLRERVAQLGGTVQTEPQPDGFRLVLSLPRSETEDSVAHS